MESGSYQPQADRVMRGADLTVFEPGMTFPVTWGDKNAGTTMWDGRYTLAYSPDSHLETAAFPRPPLTVKSARAITELLDASCGSSGRATTRVAPTLPILKVNKIEQQQ